MSREIKFRIWDDTRREFRHIEEFLYSEIFRDDKFIVQQFTGLKDKNGKDIYEGDWVQYNRNSSYDGTSFKVKWCQEALGWVLLSNCGCVLANEWTPEGNRFNFLEVVGNVCENPKPLK